MILCSGTFTHEQVDFICGILDPLAAVDPYQHAAMVAEKVRQESMFENDPKLRASYSVVVGNIDGGGPLVNIAKTVGPYTWYDIEGNYFFWAEPEFRILDRSTPAGGRAGYQQTLARKANDRTGSVKDGSMLDSGRISEYNSTCVENYRRGESQIVHKHG